MRHCEILVLALLILCNFKLTRSATRRVVGGRKNNLRENVKLVVFCTRESAGSDSRLF